MKEEEEEEEEVSVVMVDVHHDRNGRSLSRDVEILKGGQSAASWLLVKYCDFSEMMIQQANGAIKDVEERKDGSSSTTNAGATDNEEEESEERWLRRASYLSATGNKTADERIQQQVEVEEVVEQHKGHHRGNRKKLSSPAIEKHSPRIRKIRSLFGDAGGNNHSPERHSEVAAAATSVSTDPDYFFPPPMVTVTAAAPGGSFISRRSRASSMVSVATTAVAEEEVALKEGWLVCKVASAEGKNRSWKQVYLVLKPHVMFFMMQHRGDNKKVASEQLLSPASEESSHVSLLGSQVEVAEDYAKRRNVLRLRTDIADYLFQTETEASMREWLEAFEDAINSSSNNNNNNNQRRESSSAVLGSGKGLRKLTSFRNRSNSPAATGTKARKASQEQGYSSKDKTTWKGKVAKQWKKMQGSTSSGANAYPEGGSIGVPLEDCPMSDTADLVPILVTTCCGIVEERGLEVVGVYRVPGNSAAVSHLTEQVNSCGGIDGFRTMLTADPRWNDVNVVSSLLKSFFRKLPEPLFTGELYPDFIEACKVEDPTLRLNSIKALLQELPESNYETLKFICRHLRKVIEHSDVNKMEVRNLAIVFGPTLVRTADDNMLSMVTDMAQQCRIIEFMLGNTEWFFSCSEEASPVPCEAEEEESCRAMARISITGNESLLLNNLQKLEAAAGNKVDGSGGSSSAKDLVSGIFSAANRKMQRTKGKRDSIDHLDSSAGACSSSSNVSRRNSESVIQGAAAIAAAVPNLTVPSKLSPKIEQQLKPSYSQQLSVSSEDLQPHWRITEADDLLLPSNSKVLEEAMDKTLMQIELTRMMMKSHGELVSQSSLDSNVSGNSSQSAEWRQHNDLLDGGMIFLDDSSPSTQERFVNLNYRSPMADKRDKMTSFRTVSLNDMVWNAADVALLKRQHGYRKANTEPQLMPQETKTRELLQESKCDEVLNSIHASFDEKLRLLLDPHYQASSTTETACTTVSFPSRYNKPRRTSEYTMPNSLKASLKLRSVSVGNGPQKFVVTSKDSSPRKSDLKRGRFVDKNKRLQPNLLRRSDSLTKKEKQVVNADAEKKQEEADSNNNNSSNSNNSNSKENKDQRKVMRRHTLGGEIVDNAKDKAYFGSKKYSEEEEEERGDDVRRSRKRGFIQSPAGSRRFSLPDSVMVEVPAPSPPLLESMV